MDHGVFIAWAYAGVVVLVVATIAALLWDSRRVAAQLKTLEAQGVRRRSAGPQA